MEVFKKGDGMTLSAIWALIVGAKDDISLGVVAVIVLASLIQVSKININPWDWFFSHIGRKLNRELSDEVKAICNDVKQVRQDLDKHVEEEKHEKLEMQRRDILDFANACMNGRKNTQEQFTFVMKKCDEYEKYIEDNDLKNGEISSAIEEIRRINMKCRQNNTFLKPGEEFN